MIESKHRIAPRIRTRGRAALAVLAVALSLDSAVVEAQEVADFYANRSIAILVGAGPGGITDTSARIIGGFLEELVPGGPSVIVQNMPGGGSVTMANHIFRAAARDGTVLGYSLPAIIVAQLMEPGRARYDGRELSWVGSAITSTNVITVLAEMLEREDFEEAILTSMRAPVTPKQGAELQSIVVDALNTPDSVVTEAKELLGL